MPCSAGASGLQAKVGLRCVQGCFIHFSQGPCAAAALPAPCLSFLLWWASSSFSGGRVPSPCCSGCNLVADADCQWESKTERPDLGSVTGALVTLAPAFVMFEERHWVFEPGTSSFVWCFLLWRNAFSMDFSVCCFLSFWIVQWKHMLELSCCAGMDFLKIMHFSNAFTILFS